MRAMRFVTGSLFVVLTQASCCSENWTVFFVPHVVLADLGVGKGFMQLIAALTCTRLHSHVHACTHMYTPTHTCTRLPLSHVHVYTHMYTPAALTCTRLHSHVHACTHMYTPAAQAPAAATCCPGVWVSHWPRPSGLRSCCRSRQVFSLQHVSSHICYLLSWGVGKPLATAIWPQKLLSFQASVLTTARFVPHLLLAVLGCG